MKTTNIKRDQVLLESLVEKYGKSDVVKYIKRLDEDSEYKFDSNLVNLASDLEHLDREFENRLKNVWIDGKSYEGRFKNVNQDIYQLIKGIWNARPVKNAVPTLEEWKQFLLFCRYALNFNARCEAVIFIKQLIRNTKEIPNAIAFAPDARNIYGTNEINPYFAIGQEIYKHWK